MSEEKPTLLIVEDDLDIAEMLNAYFRVQGYDVLTVNWGEDGVRACQSNHPDLVILDIRLPDIDGYEVTRRLRNNRRTQEIPIIFLTEKRDREDRLKGLALKADDYITKPFDIQELRLRVRNALRRSGQGALTNTVTGLPEGNLVDERLTKCLNNRNWAILALTLTNLEPFRETYGFVAADDLMRAVALMLKDAVREIGSPRDFIGQFAPTTFLMVVDPDNLSTYKERVSKRLEQSLDYFYQEKDRNTPLFREHKLGIHLVEVLPTQEPPANLDALKARIEVDHIK